MPTRSSLMKTSDKSMTSLVMTGHNSLARCVEVDTSSDTASSLASHHSTPLVCAFAAQGFPGGGGFGGMSAEDLFREFFGGGGPGSGRSGGGSRVQRGNDVQAELVLDFMDAVTGCKYVFTPSPHPPPALIIHASPPHVGRVVQA